MPIPVILQLTLAVSALIALCLVYLIFQVRKAYTDQRGRFVRAMNMLDRFQTLQPELTTFLRRIESDGAALQKIAIQIETAVAALQENVSQSINGAAGRQTAAIESLRDHIDMQEERLAKILENILETLRTVPPSVSVAPAVAEPRRDSTEQSRLRRDTLSRDPELRFTVLQEWVSTNVLAILRRASRPWSTANDLITTIPQYLEPEAEILNHSVLLIGTRGHSVKLAVALEELEPTSDFSQWFEPSMEAQNHPAILVRINERLDLISKGTKSATALPVA